MNIAIPQSKRPAFTRFCMVLALLTLLTACSGSGNQAQPAAQSMASSAPASASQSDTISLGIPQEALDSPVVSKLPLSTVLHVVITFKPNDPLLQKLGSAKKIKGGQTSDASSLKVERVLRRL